MTDDLGMSCGGSHVGTSLGETSELSLGAKTFFSLGEGRLRLTGSGSLH